MDDLGTYIGTRTEQERDASKGDPRSDLQQEAEARKEAVKRGEGDREPDSMAAPGLITGNAGTGGETKNCDDDAQGLARSVLPGQVDDAVTVISHDARNRGNAADRQPEIIG